ncbi:MAG: DUF4282 domain-containing protein [Thermoanaerobaculia bacterium]
MANEMWNVAVDGAQLPGEFDGVQVRELLARHAGQQIRLWTPGMADWADPVTLPQFKEEPAPRVASAPRPASVPPPRATASAASPAAAPGRAASVRAALPVSADQLQEQAGIFKALLDTSFNTLLTPKLVKAVYLLVMVVMVLAVAGGILASLAGFAAGPARGMMGLAVSVIIFPLIAVLYLALFRMGLEVIMAIFKIKEYTGVLAEQARRDTEG